MKLAFGSKARLEVEQKLNDPEWIDKTSSPHGCHLWIRAIAKKTGYGQISSWNPAGDDENWRVHVAAFLLANGLEEIPAVTPHVLHNCSSLYEKTDEDPKGIKYRRCCNPSHLYAGTPQQNMDDKVREGRSSGGAINPAKGEDCSWAKLNWPKVREIRCLYKTGEWVQWQLGLKFDVHKALISNIINNKIWKEEDDPANQLKEDAPVEVANES